MANLLIKELICYTSGLRKEKRYILSKSVTAYSIA